MQAGRLYLCAWANEFAPTSACVFGFGANLFAQDEPKSVGANSFAQTRPTEHWWQHGYSSERDFIYVTTQNLSHQQLEELSAEVGGDRSL